MLKKTLFFKIKKCLDSRMPRGTAGVPCDWLGGGKVAAGGRAGEAVDERHRVRNVGLSSHTGHDHTDYRFFRVTL